MSKKERINKEKMKKLIDNQNSTSADEITDAEFELVIQALFGPHRGVGFQFE